MNNSYTFLCEAVKTLSKQYPKPGRFTKKFLPKRAEKMMQRRKTAARKFWDDRDPEPDSNISIMDPRSANYDPDAVDRYRAWCARHPSRCH